MREHSKKTILLLTDGRSNLGSDPAKLPWLVGCTIRIGKRVNYDELLGITNHYNPFNPLVLYLENYQSFSEIVNGITTMLAEGQNKCEPGADVLEKRRK